MSVFPFFLLLRREAGQAGALFLPKGGKIEPGVSMGTGGGFVGAFLFFLLLRGEADQAGALFLPRECTSAGGSETLAIGGVDLFLGRGG